MNTFDEAQLATQNAGIALSLFVNQACEESAATGKVMETPFHINHIAPISLVDFGARLAQYFHCSPACYVVAAAYVRRLQACAPYVLHPRSAHKVLLTSLTVAAKFCEDVTCTQTHFARCGGIETEELNQLEMAFLQCLSYAAFVGETEFACAHEVLLKTMAAECQDDMDTEDDSQISAAAARAAAQTVKRQPSFGPRRTTRSTSRASF